jgi:hypothetical protein
VLLCCLDQHRELLVTAGWLALLLGCLHYDLGEREQAEAARQAAWQAGPGEIVAWLYELAAWFALTEGRYHDVAEYAQAGQQHAGLTSTMLQLVLQQARGQARLNPSSHSQADSPAGHVAAYDFVIICRETTRTTEIETADHGRFLVRRSRLDEPRI